MTPEEKTLIEGVFNRLAQSGVGTKDLQADAWIRDCTQRTPDAVYGLVQAVVMLEAGLQHAQAQIADLQAQRAASPAAGGSFLPNAGGPWGAVQAQSLRASASLPTGYATQPPPSGPWVQSGVPSASPVGGFLRNAATMAAGVAGGTLIAEGINSLFGGRGYGGGFGGGGFGSGFGGGGAFGGGQGGVVENVTVNNYYDNTNDQTSDDGYQDTADDGGSAVNDDWGGGDPGDDGSI
jgi:hypothetical protein